VVSRLAADAAKRADALLILQEVAQPAAQADRVTMIGIEACQPGVTEREGAQQKAQTFGDDGAEEDHATLVASGANRAFPHHEAGNRKPSRGDTVVIDIVATLDGYKSDITRVVHLGDPSADGREVYATVLEANQRGREAAQAGARASALDLGLEHPGPGAGHGLRFGVRIEDIVVVADGPCRCLTGLDRALTVRDL